MLSQYPETKHHHQKHLEIAQELKDLLGEGTAYCNLGNVHQKPGDYTSAETYFRQSIEIFSRFQQEVNISEWQISLFEEWSKPYNGLERSLLLQNKFDEALEVSDMRRACALLSLVSDKFSSENQQEVSLEALTVDQM
ncbi:MAG: tetratricopeptide repeat protein [Candidatus Rhabdochlamydia sp.]